MNQRYLTVLATVSLVALLGGVTPGMSASVKDLGTLSPTDGWRIGTVTGAGAPYCAMVGGFDQKSTMAVARDAKGNGTIALNFSEGLFTTGTNYETTLQIGNAAVKKYTAQAPAPNAVIIQIKEEPALFESLTKNGTLTANVSVARASFEMDDFDKGYENLQACTAGLEKDKITSAEDSKPIDDALADLSGDKEKETKSVATNTLDEMEDDLEQEDQAVVKKAAVASVKKPEAVKMSSSAIDQPAAPEASPAVSENDIQWDDVPPKPLSKTVAIKMSPSAIDKPVEKQSVEAVVASATPEVKASLEAKENPETQENIVPDNASIVSSSQRTLLASTRPPSAMTASPVSAGNMARQMERKQVSVIEQAQSGGVVVSTPEDMDKARQKILLDMKKAEGVPATQLPAEAVEKEMAVTSAKPAEVMQAHRLDAPTPYASTRVNTMIAGEARQKAVDLTTLTAERNALQAQLENALSFNSMTMPDAQRLIELENQLRRSEKAQKLMRDRLIELQHENKRQQEKLYNTARNTPGTVANEVAVKSMQAEADNLATQLEAETQANAKMKQELAAQKLKVDRQEDALHDRQQHLQQQLTDKEAQITSLQRELAQEKTRVSGVSATLLEDFKKLTAEMEAKEKRLQLLEQKLDRLSQNKPASNNNVPAMNESRIGDMETASETKRELKEAQNELAVLRQQQSRHMSEVTRHVTSNIVTSAMPESLPEEAASLSAVPSSMSASKISVNSVPLNVDKAAPLSLQTSQENQPRALSMVDMPSENLPLPMPAPVPTPSPALAKETDSTVMSVSPIVDTVQNKPVVLQATDKAGVISRPMSNRHLTAPPENLMSAPMVVTAARVDDVVTEPMRDVSVTPPQETKTASVETLISTPRVAESAPQKDDDGIFWIEDVPEGLDVPEIIISKEMPEIDVSEDVLADGKTTKQPEVIVETVTASVSAPAPMATPTPTDSVTSNVPMDGAMTAHRRTEKRNFVTPEFIERKTTMASTPRRAEPAPAPRPNRAALFLDNIMKYHTSAERETNRVTPSATTALKSPHKKGVSSDKTKSVAMDTLRDLRATSAPEPALRATPAIPQAVQQQNLMSEAVSATALSPVIVSAPTVSTAPVPMHAPPQAQVSSPSPTPTLSARPAIAPAGAIISMPEDAHHSTPVVTQVTESKLSDYSTDSLPSAHVPTQPRQVESLVARPADVPSPVTLEGLLDKSGMRQVKVTSVNTGSDTLVRRWKYGAVDGMYEKVLSGGGNFKVDVENYLDRYRSDCPGQLSVDLGHVKTQSVGQTLKGSLACSMPENTYNTSFIFLGSDKNFNAILHTGYPTQSDAVQAISDTLDQQLSHATDFIAPNAVNNFAPVPVRSIPVSAVSPYMQSDEAPIQLIPPASIQPKASEPLRFKIKEIPSERPATTSFPGEEFGTVVIE